MKEIQSLFSVRKPRKRPFLCRQLGAGGSRADPRHALLIGLRLLLVLWICSFSEALSEAQKRVFSGDFELEYGDQFEEAALSKQMRSEGVLLLLRQKTASYPTCNVVQQTGPWKSLGSERDAKAVLDSYHLVGLLDAKLTGKGSIQVGPQRLPAFTVGYAYGGQRLESLVMILPYVDRHYLITYVVLKAGAVPLDLETLPAGIQLSLLRPAVVFGPSPESFSAWWRLLVLSIAVLGIPVVWLLWARSRRPQPGMS